MLAAFWDSSALVPLCVAEPNTPRCLVLEKSYDIVTWWATPVELASALARMLRTKMLGVPEYNRALKAASGLSNSLKMVGASADLRDKAIQLVGRHQIKAADALQLAAALEWCEDRPAGRIFLTADDRLRNAAALCGFDTSKL